MKEASTLETMTRLGWDQSFLQDFSASKDSSRSSEEILGTTSLPFYENISNNNNNNNNNNDDDNDDDDALWSVISYANSSAIVDSNRLKFLMCQVERKQLERFIIDNSYSSSSSHSSSPLIEDRANLPTSSFFACQKGAKHLRNDSCRRKDPPSKSPRKISPARDDPRTPGEFLLSRMVGRYGLARVLGGHWHDRDSPYSPLELQKIKRNLIQLVDSGFYFGMLSADDSKQLLIDGSVGNFFLRDSSNPGHLLSLSVMTRRGATSIRIHFRDGRFGLDTDSESPFAPKFDSVLRLVQHYVENPYKNVLVESSGRCDTPVVLKRPLLLSVPRLSHLARLKINGRLRGHRVDRLCLIPSLKLFLKQYPFSV